MEYTYTVKKAFKYSGALIAEGVLSEKMAAVIIKNKPGLLSKGWITKRKKREEKKKDD